MLGGLDESEQTLTLHTYWRSSAAYRVRIALALKGISYTSVTRNLLLNEHRSADYASIAPHGLVPALEYGKLQLIESPAIIEFIEARWPEPALLPKDVGEAAIVRGMAALIACDIHPINNLRVLEALRRDFSATPDQVTAWIQGWITEGFSALELLIERYGRGFAFGDKPTVADCYVVPQIYNARRFSVDLRKFPCLTAAAELVESLPAVKVALPSAQPDAV